ncbi:Altered inheritance of mitochondria protein 18 mitochondrial [Maudiozyma exigua]|uniref:Altered inheritance of mitochondria protein 18, mitochondrial n=1 Tax=Maudiozyma exigua TaxID=34358 RepID=A0A9P7BBJ5_MAUEX|nr:Altered inheritance of mitochondria protein 18 mitochondrial [Kazachstania exigua]
MYTFTLSKAIARNSITKNVKLCRFSTFPRLRTSASASTNTSAKTATHQKRIPNYWIAGALGLGAGALLYSYQQSEKLPEIQYFEINDQINSFPSALRPPLYPLSTNYSLLGLGVRSVIVESFKVYGLGIYIADEDKKLVPMILNSFFLKKTFIDIDESKTHKENIKAALDDPEKSVILARNLLDGGVRMTAKFTPIKNTNLTFVREGIIKTIWNHPDAEANKEVLEKGIDELRHAFNKKGSFLKDDDLLMELNSDGSLQMTYINCKHGDIYKMDLVKEPAVGRFLFSQYMSGPKPLSVPCKDEITKSLVDLV